MKGERNDGRDRKQISYRSMSHANLNQGSTVSLSLKSDGSSAAMGFGKTDCLICKTQYKQTFIRAYRSGTRTDSKLHSHEC